jgi:hypothetical protein
MTAVKTGIEANATQSKLSPPVASRSVSGFTCGSVSQ